MKMQNNPSADVKREEIFPACYQVEYSMAVCPFLQPVLAEALLSISALVFMLQPLLKTQMNFICDYQVMLFKEVDGRVLMPQQKCNLAFSWLAWACEGGSGSWKPNLAALVGLPDENLVKEYCHHFCRAHFSSELTDVWRAFLWGLGALHCLCSVGAAGRADSWCRCWSPWASSVRSAWTAGTGVGSWALP